MMLVRIRRRLAHSPLGLAIIGTASLVGAGLAIWLLGWPPVNAGAWRLVNPLIVLATLAGWSCWFLSVRALHALPLDEPPGPESYAQLIQRRLQHAGRWLAACGVAASAMVLMPGAFMDLVIAAIPGFGDDFPVFSFDAHQLYLLALLMTYPDLIALVLGVATIGLAADLGRRLWPANEEESTRFGLAAIADPVVKPYRVELQRLGRRLIREDVERLGTRLELRGRKSDVC